MDKERFSMLLLDPGEILFDEYSVQTKQSCSDKWIDGSFKLCSKSLVFVPKHPSLPLIKLPLNLVEKLEKSSLNSCEILCVACKQHIEMLEGSVLAPYKFIHQASEFQFSFNYVKLDDCLARIQQLQRAASLPTAEQASMIMTIVYSIQSRFKFDTSWLVDAYEEIIHEVQANKLLPLVVNPGRLLLTTARLYFQPYNKLDQYPVQSLDLKAIKSVIKRRFLLRQIGLEIKWIGQKLEHLFISTGSQEERDALYDALLNQPLVNIETVSQNQMTMRWQNGSLSNYDYLMYLNSLADRTFNDLTQYPVMPWVLSDFTSETLDLKSIDAYRDLSKPIGALEPNRLKKLKDRYAEMSEPKFLYGSHYSAPGFVLFYLVRKYPQYMLCLQNGKFDHPDRMFNSIADVWKNVLNNMSDFKELTPEFYDTESAGDFLINSYGIDFGYRHDGSKIGDVLLPPWAKDQADFVGKMRNALESDWVSKNLNNWIDLIFGYKQKGDQAVKADNVFFHLCYEGAIDLDTIQDMNDRHGLEVQIMEFGQIPKQLFLQPHPKKLILSEDKGNENFNIKSSLSFQSHKQAVSAVTIEMENLVSVGFDGVMKIHCLKTGNLKFNVSLSTVALTSCVSYKSCNNFIVVVGSNDNNLIFYDLEYGKINRLNGHQDTISCLAYSKKGILISGSLDCTVKIWSIPHSAKPIKFENLITELVNESGITCMAVSSDESLLVAGTQDGEISLWNLNNHNLEYSIIVSVGQVNSVTFAPESKNIVTCSADKSLNVIDVQTSTKIYFNSLNEEAISLAWLDSTLLIGDNNGNLGTWCPRSDKFNSKFNCHQGSLTCLYVTTDKEIVTGSSDKRILLWKVN